MDNNLILDIVQKTANEYPKGPIEHALLTLKDRLMEVQEIEARIRVYEKHSLAETMRHQEANLALKHELEKAQELCNHPWVTHYPDAAGGSDSWDECNICKKQW